MATNFKITKCWNCVILIFGLTAACLAKDNLLNDVDDKSAEVCHNPKGCENNQDKYEHEVDVHKYDAKHQVKHLYPKNIDDELSKIKIPHTFDEIRNSMQKCR